MGFDRNDNETYQPPKWLIGLTAILILISGVVILCMK